ncbi:MAG: patatin-like phospholipase family protein [Gammaproteobacteria bacterium]|nr:patatin-like phospholipase family protein [Gammaproteobacteria bacterium]
MLSPFDRPVIHTATLICFLFLVTGHTATASAQDAVNERPRIGLALSGGGARGAAHIGVLKILERERIPIDYIAGTSMGSIVGGMYASGMSLEDIESQLVAVDWDDVFEDKIDREDRSFRRKTDDRLWLIDNKPGFNDGEINLPPGLVQGQKINKLLAALTLPVADIDDFDDLAIPYRAVAADIQTGEKVVLSSGNLPKAIRASMSIPAIIAPVPWGDRMLVDGGIAGNLPIEVVREMGADIIIAVDISTPLRADDVADSLLSIAEQLSGFLTRRNVQTSVTTLTDQDILITPDLGDIGAGDFDRIAEAVPTGFVAAEAALARIREHALNEEAYVAHVAARALPSGEVPVIEFVRFDNKSRISDDFLRGRLRIASAIGRPLDVEDLEKAIDELYGLEIFSVVAYEIVQEDGKHGLWIRALPKSWGPNYLQVGIKWNTSFNGEGIFNFSASLLKTALNSWNGEWRTAAALGEEPGIISEFYQPLGTQAPWFAGTKAGFNQFSVNRFSATTSDIEEQFRIKQFGLSVYGGREFGTWGRGILTYTRGSGDRSIRIGDPSIPDQDFDIGELSLKVEVDELDNLYFPNHGHIAAATYRISRTDLGSSQDYDQALLTAGIARTRGKNTLQLAIDYRTTTSGVAPPERRFRAGGLFNLSGFEFNQLSGQHYGRLIGMYRRQFGHMAFADLSAGTSLEYGNVWENRGDIDIDDGLFAGSLFLGADTAIGPVYLGYGLAEGGNSSFYLYIGALRNDPALQ